MKLGIVEGAFPASWSAEQKFKKAHELGFNGIELWMGENEIVGLDSTKEYLESLRALADKYEIKLSSLGNQLCWNYSLTADDMENRKKAIETAKKQLEFASYLGCETILILPGAVGVDFIKNFPVVPYDVAYKRAVEVIKELVPYAEKLNVNMGIENVSNKLLLSPLETKAFIDEVGSEYLGSYFDVGNALEAGYPEHWINILGNRIKKIHLKDFSRATGRFVTLLEGDVDYSAVASSLKNIGYDGWLTAEYVYNEDTYEEGTKKLIEAMNKIITM